jgi:glycine betaine/proline transport system ATP-binding protein
MQQSSDTHEEAVPTTDTSLSGNGQDSPTNEPHISVKSLWKVFGKDGERIFDAEHAGKDKAGLLADLDCVVALQDVSFDVERGETFVVMGLSGSGKSTLVRCLIRLIEPTSGQVIIDGENVLDFDDKDLTGLRRNKVAMVFQHYGLLPHRSVLENAAYGLEIRGVDQATRYEKAAFMLEKVGLNGWEHASTHELSGGMQQRVGLARALTVDPEILLMDEPFSGLDPLIRRQMREELASLQAELKKTIVFITHDLEEAITIGNRIAIMREGKIIQLGSPEDIVARPEDQFVSDFTRGISKTRVLTICSIAEYPDAIASSDDSTEKALQVMETTGEDAVFVLGENRQYLGIATREEASRSGSVPLSDVMTQTPEAVLDTTPIEDVLPLLLGHDIPIPVVDADGRLLGVATHDRILEMVVISAKEQKDLAAVGLSGI